MNLWGGEGGHRRQHFFSDNKTRQYSVDILPRSRLWLFMKFFYFFFFFLILRWVAMLCKLSEYRTANDVNKSSMIRLAFNKSIRLWAQAQPSIKVHHFGEQQSVSQTNRQTSTIQWILSHSNNTFIPNDPPSTTIPICVHSSIFRSMSRFIQSHGVRICHGWMINSAQGGFHTYKASKTIGNFVIKWNCLLGCFTVAASDSWTKDTIQFNR